MNFFAVARGVRRDLRGFLPRPTRALEILPNLLAAGAGCIEVFLCEAFDLRGTAPACCRNFVTELAQFVGQLRLIDGCGELLRGEEALRLDGTRLAVVPLSNVENDRVGVQLWRDIAINRTGGSCSNLAAINLPVVSGG